MRADCEFLGFQGDQPPLLISTDSYATLSGCAFRDFDISVEVIDVSYGGRLRLEDCTFENVVLRRNPPKFVSTSLNDELTCTPPFD